jgi:hypothetical protein
MKNELQARRRREYAGLTDEQIRRRMQEKLRTSSDPVSRKWRELEESDRASQNGP